MKKLSRNNSTLANRNTRSRNRNTGRLQFLVRRTVKNAEIRYKKKLWVSPNLEFLNNFTVSIFRNSKGSLFAQFGSNNLPFPITQKTKIPSQLGDFYE